ncbi:hypothetical protein [Persicirhabdus sediminis]|uniref:Uncharacterized protein n=1 Tax=Persicirhabdus sediminis TaxID=454144 RepID=A0A8J7SIE7_9BACT|nr:hypothetical protein [Persicirhabdus sediminis]MBK1790391.1 hypothetical protein [Persicirhabdus sediminis]
MIYQINTLACYVCMGNGPDHKDSLAAGYAMLFMLCIIMPVLCAIFFFIIRIARRSAAALPPELQDHPPVS